MEFGGHRSYVPGDDLRFLDRRATMRHGQLLFHTANSDQVPITQNHWVACASCHLEGRSDAVLGNPVTAVAWLARKVESFGVRLCKGDIVLPGSCTKAIDARPGDEFVAAFTGLGSVHLSFE